MLALGSPLRCGTYLDLLAVVVELVLDDSDDAVGADRLGLGGQGL